MPTGVYKHKKGRKVSMETRRKLSESLKGRIPWNKGKSLSWEHRRKMRENHRGGMSGKHHSREAKRKIGEASKGRAINQKENNPNWQGGISFEPYSVDWRETLKRSIRERDRYTCRLCGKQQGDKAFAVHHIDYDKKNCNPSNLITLCSSCHSKTNFNRNYWIKFFESIKK